MSIPFQMCEARRCERDAWFLCRRCLRWLCQTHEPEETHDCTPAVSLDDAMDEIAEGTFLDEYTEEPGGHPLPPAVVELAAAAVPPTSWKMFEPCKIGDCAACSVYAPEGRTDWQCSCDCHE